MKQYKVLKACAHSGDVGTVVSKPDDQLTESLLKQGVLAELKVEAPTEKKTRKPRATKKAK